VGCKFYVKVIYLNEEGREIVIHVNTEYHGHESGSMTDCYFLLVHQSVVSICVEMLKNLNNIQLTLAYSKRCEEILCESVSLHEQKIFRFFLIQKKHLSSRIVFKCKKGVVKMTMKK